MLKYILLLIAVVAVTIVEARPQSQQSTNRQYKTGQDATATILRSETNVADASGAYSFAYETSNGIKHQEEGHLEKAKLKTGTEPEAMEVKGSYSYIGPDGKTVTVTYTAGENGFRPKITYA